MVRPDRNVRFCQEARHTSFCTNVGTAYNWDLVLDASAELAVCLLRHLTSPSGLSLSQAQRGLSRTRQNYLATPVLLDMWRQVNPAAAVASQSRPRTQIWPQFSDLPLLPSGQSGCPAMRRVGKRDVKYPPNFRLRSLAKSDESSLRKILSS